MGVGELRVGGRDKKATRIVSSCWLGSPAKNGGFLKHMDINKESRTTG